VPRPLRGRLFNQLLQLRPANGFSLVIIFLERRIVFVVRMIGHLRSALEMHAHGALMKVYDLRSQGWHSIAGRIRSSEM
jgi:hypothetical protein